jgi:CAAX protease family protein
MYSIGKGQTAHRFRQLWRIIEGVRPLLVYGAFALFFGVSAAVELRRYPLGAAALAGIYGCLLLLIGLWLLPAFPELRERARRRFAGLRGALLVWAMLLVSYLLYSLGTADFSVMAVARLAGMASLPIVIFAAFPVRSPQKLAWQDGAALVWLATPVLAGWLRGLWTVPVNLDFMARLFVVVTGAWSYLVFRGTEGAGYEARFSAGIARAAGVNFALFSVIGVPLGLALRFIAWNPHWQGAWQFFFDGVTIFVFIAIPEEFLFRGLLQNLLEGSWGSRYGAQAVAAVLFGLMHILHGFPNWRYVLMASIAGWFYGSAWRSTRSLVASGVTHALVDAIWRTWFEAL